MRTRSITPERLFSAPIGSSMGIDVASEILLDGLEHAGGVSAVAVHAIDHDQARSVVFLAVVPDALRDYFDSSDAIDDHDGGVDHGESHLCLMDEHVEARRVEDVDLGFAPLDDCQTGRDRHLAGDFFVVVVGRGRTVIDAAEAREWHPR